MSSAITSKTLFWGALQKMEGIYSPKSPVIVQGKMLAMHAESMQMDMFRACDAVDHFAKKLFSNPPRRILDLGAGIGANTLPMAKSGAHVTAIDRSQELLETLRKRSIEARCPQENLQLLCADITTMESYGGPFNLVLAIDILPYVPPKMLHHTMEKIQRCLEDRGTLIGTIFTTKASPVIREMMGKLGAHFYENGTDFTTKLLQYSGFTVVELEARSEGGLCFRAEKLPVDKNNP